MSKTCDCGAKWSHPTDMFLHKRVNCPLKKETFQIQPEEEPFDFDEAENIADYFDKQADTVNLVDIPVHYEHLHQASALLRDAVKRLKGE